MDRPALCVLAAAALLALAGCSATTAPATPEPERPPGVANGTVVNATELVTAHETVLRDDGGAYRINQTTASSGDTDVRVAVNVTGAASENFTRVRYTADGVRVMPTERTLMSTEIYANATTVVTREELAGNTSFTTANRTEQYDDVLATLVWKPNVLESLLKRGGFEVTAVEQRGDGWVTTLTADRYTGDRLQNVTRYDATVRVAVDGRLLSVSETLAGTTARTNETRTITMTAVNESAVPGPEPPAWAA